MITYYVGANTDFDGRDVTPRVFRENDRLGHESHFLLRPMRRLVKDLKPSGIVTPIACTVNGDIAGHLGALYTGRDRVCFYPAYATGTDMTKVFDHVTLEVANGTAERFSSE